MAIITVCGILIQSLIFSSGETAYELYSIGLQNEMAGNIVTAIEYYKEALKKDPYEPDIYVSLANAFYQVRQFDQGIAIGRAGLNVAPLDLNLLEIIAIGYLGKGDLMRAIKAYRDLQDQCPECIEHYETLSILYESIKDLKTAQQVLLDIPDTLKIADTYVQLGLLAGKAKDHGTAIGYYRKGFALDALNSTVLVGLGTGFDIINVKDSAIYYYERSLFDDTLLSTVGRRLVDLYADVDAYPELIAIAHKILSLDPEDGYVRRSLGFALYKTGSLDSALQEFMLASRMHPDDVYSRFYIGRIYLENRKCKNALTEISEALAINPDFIELWVYLGFVAIDTRDYDLARTAFHEAAHRGGDLIQLYYLLGVTHEMQGNETEAHRYYRKALTEAPEDIPSLDALAHLLERVDRKEDAFRIFTRIIELDSTNATAMNYVGYMLAERSDSLEYALELIDRALQLDAHNAFFIDSRGWVFFKMGRYEDALFELQRAADITDDAVILEHLGDAYMQLSQKEKARTAYLRALNMAPDSRTLQQKLEKLKHD
ncbi:tetratricopeptide repeat protein [candidate division WOR-3 bacterium]|nr:tetratricopeptide repeat protein [candidate division WOR-3 bacterium]